MAAAPVLTDLHQYFDEAGLDPGPKDRQRDAVPLRSHELSAYPMYFVDSGRPLTVAPPLLKTRSHMRRNDARNLWRNLQHQG
jgi:hypothetical protein